MGTLRPVNFSQCKAPSHLSLHPFTQLLGMKNAQCHLRYYMLRCHKVDVVHLSYLLQFDVPLPQLLRRQIKAILLMGDVMILAKHAT